MIAGFADEARMGWASARRAKAADGDGGNRRARRRQRHRLRLQKRPGITFVPVRGWVRCARASAAT